MFNLYRKSTPKNNGIMDNDNRPPACPSLSHVSYIASRLLMPAVIQWHLLIDSVWPKVSNESTRSPYTEHLYRLERFVIRYNFLLSALLIEDLILDQVDTAPLGEHLI